MENLKKLKVGKYRCLNSWDQELPKVIKKTLFEAEYVYAYKTYNQGFDEIELMKWIKSTSLTNFKKVEIEFTEEKENQIKEIKSVVSEDYVYELELNEITRNKFIELFRISIIGASADLAFPRELFLDDIYIDDSVYDHYDFVFTIDNEVLLLTDIHPFQFLASEELYCKVQEEHHTLHSVKCEMCGNTLTRITSDGKEYFRCNYQNLNIYCFNVEIAVNNVEESIFQIIKTHVKLVIEKEKIEQKETDCIDNKAIEKEISKLEKNLKPIKLQKVPLYEQFKNRKISKENYFKMEELSDKIQVIQIQLEHLKERVNEQIQSNDIISSNKNLSFDKLTREMYDQFVSKVIVGPEGRLEIKMKYEDSFEKK